MYRRSVNTDFEAMYIAVTLACGKGTLNQLVFLDTYFEFQENNTILILSRLTFCVMCIPGTKWLGIILENRCCLLHEKKIK